MKFEIDRAMAYYTMQTGKRMTRKQLAETVLPTTRESTRHIMIKTLCEGPAKRPDPKLLIKIARVLKVDMNFLFGWNKNFQNEAKYKYQKDNAQ